MPTMPEAFLEQVSNRYIQLYETVTGKPFEKADTHNILHRIEQNILDTLSQ
ncbi:MAG: phosphoribosylaminoimidazolesuccinocarboxamide synthase, partial [Saprospiraceae bacterium]|nr:phosphoribosylaminoimidazolesuccinocarboxamide synthase [Saprospiraceae bacterium]